MTTVTTNTAPMVMKDSTELQAAKAVVRAWLDASCQHYQSAKHLLADHAEWHCSHPVNVVQGFEAIQQDWCAPLAQAFQGLERRQSIFMAGGFNGQFNGGAGIWVSTTGYYTGVFEQDLWGIKAHHKLAFLRFGEFYRVENGCIVEARILVDLVDLARQTGRNLLPKSNGEDILIPSPADQGGLMYAAQTDAHTLGSISKIHNMIDGLMRFDGVNLATMGMHEHWSPNMMWYGPCGIGSMRRLDGFQTHHQKPFLIAFPDRKGAGHRARIAEGRYVGSTGWPSVIATHAGEYLGVPASNVKIGMRVMDWWRTDDDTIVENWVMIDLPHLMLQMGVDLLKA